MTRSRDVADTQDNLGGAVAPYVGAKNAVINGGFDIWARGTSFTNGAGTSLFGADRWHIYSTDGAGRTWTRQTTSDTTNLPFIQYCLRAARNSGVTSTNSVAITQDFETANSLQFAGKTFTVSFYARRGANYSATSNILNFDVVQGTGTDQNSLTGFTNQTPVISGTATLTTTWQRFSFTGTMGSLFTQLGIQIYGVPTGTAGAADFYEITGIQLELGSVATPFSRAGGSIGGELALCQRYYYLHASGASKYICMAAAYTASASYGYLQYPVTMRTTPTMAVVTGTNYYLMYRNGTYNYFNTLNQDYGSSSPTGATGTGVYIGGLSQTSGWSGWFQTDNAASSIAFSAEL